MTCLTRESCKEKGEARWFISFLDANISESVFVNDKDISLEAEAFISISYNNVKQNIIFEIIKQNDILFRSLGLLRTGSIFFNLGYMTYLQFLLIDEKLKFSDNNRRFYLIPPCFHIFDKHDEFPVTKTLSRCV